MKTLLFLRFFTSRSLLFAAFPVRNALELYTVDSEMQVLPVESVPSIESLRDATVTGSINGLVCVKSEYKFLMKILLLNPVISKFRLLTRRANSFDYIGFGFCSIVKDYKVLIISSRRHQVEVYSLSTCSWKEVEFGGLLDGVLIMFDGFGTNGAIFWFGFKKGNGLLLVSYCIATEEFALIPLPFSAAVFIDSHYYRLSVYENKLACFAFSHYHWKL
ncbi:hypothetical protein K1719_016608 [Acacia pycnantha]|nr:hypothetical protein K1719_016608 [Acacia pycnantha]